MPVSTATSEAQIDVANHVVKNNDATAFKQLGEECFAHFLIALGARVVATSRLIPLSSARTASEQGLATALNGSIKREARRGRQKGGVPPPVNMAVSATVWSMGPANGNPKAYR